MKLRILLGAAVVIVLALAVLPAVSVAGTINATGTVTDANGDPVSGANVTLIDDYFNTLCTTVTDTNGNFDFHDVETGGSYLVKASVTYIHDGQKYGTRLEDVNWNDASQGILKLNPAETRLYDYPISDYGYIWGIVTDGNNRSLDCTVYLANSITTISKQTGGSGMSMKGSYQFQVSPGKYTMYAVYEGDDYRLVSNMTRVTILPSHSIMQSAPMTLICDQRHPSGAVKVVPLAIALVIGALAIVTGMALLKRES